jgi:hypothetical protein
LAVKHGTATRLQKSLTWKPAAKFAAWLSYIRNSCDCMMAVAERPAV